MEIIFRVLLIIEMKVIFRCHDRHVSQGHDSTPRPGEGHVKAMLSR